MALINCPECGKEVSDTASKCIHCGCDLKKLNKGKRKRKINKKRILQITAVIVILVIVFVLLLFLYLIPEGKYKKAEKLLKNGDYDDAIEEFTNLGNYKDSDNRIKECYYEMGINLISDDNAEDAIAAFEEAGDYNDASDKIEEIKEEQKRKAEEARKQKEEEEKAEKLETFKQIVEKINSGNEYYNQSQLLVDQLNSQKYIEDIYVVACSISEYQEKAAECYNEAKNLCGSISEFSNLKSELTEAVKYPEKPLYPDKTYIDYWSANEAYFLLAVYQAQTELKSVKTKIGSDVEILDIDL